MDLATGTAGGNVDLVPAYRFSSACVVCAFCSTYSSSDMCWMTVNAPIVTAGYFETMEMRIVRGHPISTLDERGAPPVAVLNETLARRLWPGSDAVGRSLAVELFGQKSTKVIVGIVANVRT